MGIGKTPADAALAASERRFRTLFELATDAIFVADAETGMLLDANRKGLELIGRSLDEVRGMHQSELHPAEIAPKAGEEFRFSVEREIPGFVEIDVIRKDGRRVPVEISSGGVIDADGRRIHVGIFRDVTDRMRASASLRNSETRYRELFASHPAPMWVYDLETLRFLAVNNAAIAHYGYTREEFLSMTIKDIRPPEDVPALLVNVTGVKDGLDVAGVWRHRKKDGSLIHVEITSHVLEFDGRRAEVVMAMDVTERRSAVEALRESEERFRLLAEQMPQAVYEADTEGRFTYMNRHGHRLFGYGEEEPLGGIGIIDLLDPADRDRGRENLRKRVADGYTDPVEYTFLRKDGTTFPALLASASFSRGGRIGGVGGVVVDLSGIRITERKLQNAQRYEAVAQVAGGIAHHLNNLMTVVAGYGTLVVERMDVRAPWRREVEEMRRAGERAAALTAQLLAYSRRQIIWPERIDLERFFKEIESEIRDLAGPKANVSVLPDPGAGTVLVDREQLRNAVLRLVENGRDAVPEGGAIVVLSRYAGEPREGGPPIPLGEFAMISVTDTGSGMDPETRARVFEPFFTTKEPSRAGLSLPSVYGFIKQSQGYIFVESEPGKGTTVSIYLPQAEPGEGGNG